MSTYNIVFLGDIVGRPGREAVKAALPTLRERYKPRFIIANAENSAAGIGITPAIADEILSWGIDALTLGNHAFDKREMLQGWENSRPVVRPHNLPKRTPGTGLIEIERDGTRLAIINLCGRVFLNGYDDPFRAIDELKTAISTPHVFLDFHAEATSEKIAMGYHCSGWATAVIGTHTHVPTADSRILDGGTAYQSDTGMCGPYDGVLGMDRSRVLQRFLTSLPVRFEVHDGPGVISGVRINVESVSGRALSIERFGGPERGNLE
ncbi:MAG: TIGR00282 family metallophosphoesterase [Fimbriimonadaceae bacterium]|nr:TIGR00282 family metallophosphoesterase [Fimbriimonadaceae bacterium]